MVRDCLSLGSCHKWSASGESEPLTSPRHLLGNISTNFSRTVLLSTHNTDLHLVDHAMTCYALYFTKDCLQSFKNTLFIFISTSSFLWKLEEFGINLINIWKLLSITIISQETNIFPQLLKPQQLIKEVKIKTKLLKLLPNMIASFCSD